MVVRDSYGNPTLQGQNKGSAVSIGSTDNTNLKTTHSKQLKQVIKLDLLQARDKQAFNIKANEITFAVVDGSISFYLNGTEETKNLTIESKCSIETEVNFFYISNESKPGKLEIWLWE